MKNILIYPYTKNMEKVNKDFFERKFGNRRKYKLIYIKNKDDLLNTRGRGYLDIYLPELNDFTTFNNKVIQDILNDFSKEESIKLKYEEEQIDKVVKKITFISAATLNDGDRIVFRDRENPNMKGKVSIKNNKMFINNVEYDENHPFSYKHIRLVKEDEKYEEYFLDENLGFILYESSNTLLSSTKLFEALKSIA